MKTFLGGRGAAAARGILAFAMAGIGATSAPAQVAPANATTTAYLGSGQAVRAVSTPAAAIASAPIAVARTFPLTAITSAGTLPLSSLVAMHSAGAALDAEANCMAVAVYHEARGESLEGQLAVARVIMNRAASGKYPSSWCGVVKQPWQFSFVRNGHLPAVDSASDAWRKAQAVTRIAIANAAPSVGTDVLWYHADYVAPSWGKRLTIAQQIGTHIFYRS